MKELIERLEKLTGPDRAMDVEIECAMQPLSIPFKDFYAVWHSSGASHVVPSYTGSIDAAMTLVPEGYAPSTGPSFIHSGHGYVANIHRIGKHMIGESMAHGRHTSLATALCIAALRARQAGKEG